MTTSELIKSRKGYSLLEVVVAMSIVITIFWGTALLMQQSAKQNKVITKMAEDKSFITFTLKNVKNLFLNMKHRYIDPQQLFSSSDMQKTRSSSFSQVNKNFFLDHEATPYLNNGVAYYNNSSTLSSIQLNSDGDTYSNGEVTIIDSLCVNSSEFDKLESGTPQQAFAIARKENRSFPVVFTNKKDARVSNVQCCSKVGRILSCTSANKKSSRPVIVNLYLNESGEVLRHSVFPKKKDVSLGVGFFYYLDRSNGENDVLKLDYFSIFDPCQSSNVSCDKSLNPERSLSNYPTHIHSLVQKLSYPIKSASSFIIQ